MSGTKFRVAIIGGGIGGLNTAIALAQAASIEVDIYEAASDFGNLGTGLGLWSRAWKILDKLGMGNDLANLTSDVLNNELRLTYRFRKSDQPEGFDIGEIITPGGIPTFHRAHLQLSILKHLPASTQCHVDKRLVSYTDQDEVPICLTFQDGSTASCDLLVGADGIRSAVRGTLLKNLAYSNPPNDSAENALCSHITWSGSIAYRALVPAALIKLRAPEHRALAEVITMYCGKYKHVVAYPISQGTLINVVAFLSHPSLEGTPFQGPWMVDFTKEDLLRSFQGWEEEVTILLECIDDLKQYAVHALRPLSSYASRRVALIGDAAHAMTPHQGSGAGQAIEDGYILAALLSEPSCTLETIPRALKIYNEIRQPAANRVLEGSRKTGMLFAMYDDELDGEKIGPIFSRTLKEIKVTQWQRAWMTTADEDRQLAIEKLRREVLVSPYVKDSVTDMLAKF